MPNDLNFNNLLFMILAVMVPILLLLHVKRRRYPYKAKKNIFTPSEYSFYRTLKPVAQELGYEVFAKVRIADILDVTSDDKNHKYFRLICAKHVDYLLCKNGKPILPVELDDPSHEKKDRKKRDIFVKKAYESAGLNLLSIYVSNSYNADVLKLEIQKAIKGVK